MLFSGLPKFFALKTMHLFHPDSACMRPTSFLWLLSFLLFPFATALANDVTYELKPVEIQTRPLGYWDFSLKFTYLNPQDPIEDRRVAEWEVLSVLKGGTAHTHGLKTGDRILEINGEKNLLRTEIEDFLCYGEIGDQIRIKVVRVSGNTEEMTVILHDAQWEDFTILMCGLEIQYPLQCGIFVRRDIEDYYIVSQSFETRLQGRNLLAIRTSRPEEFFTFQDKRSHKNDPRKFVIFDESGRYQIRKK